MLRCSLSSAYTTHVLERIDPGMGIVVLAPEHFPGKGPTDFSGMGLRKRTEMSLHAVLWITTNTYFQRSMTCY